MTDHIDTLLAEDGARWRAAQPPPREPDPALFGGPRGRWQPVAAAAVVVLLAAGSTAGVALTRREPSTAAGTGFSELLVSDGDRVAVSGLVHAPPGGPVRICRPRPGTADPCAQSVTVAGVDLDRLAGRAVVAGTVTGRARVEGRYVRGTVTVDRQSAPDPEPPEPTDPPRPGCPAPAGGWIPGRIPADRSAGLDSFVGRQPDRFTHVRSAFTTGGAEVLEVATAIDRATAERELRTVWAGNLCVVTAGRDPGLLLAVGGRVDSRDMDAHGVYGLSSDPWTGEFGISLVLVDREALARLRRVDGGTGVVVVRAFVRPLR